MLATAMILQSQLVSALHNYLATAQVFEMGGGKLTDILIVLSQISNNLHKDTSKPV